MAADAYPRNLLRGRDEAILIHKYCNGEIEPIPHHGLHCLDCDRVVENFEVLEAPIPNSIHRRLTARTEPF